MVAGSTPAEGTGTLKICVNERKIKLTSRRDFLKLLGAGALAATGLAGVREVLANPSQTHKVYMPLVKAPTKNVVWTIGDSIVHGYGGMGEDIRTWMIYNNWKLKFIGTQVSLSQHHDGHDGYTTVDILNNLPTWAQQIIEYPRNIFVHAGTADLEKGTTPNLQGIVDFLKYHYPYAYVHVARIIQNYPSNSKVTNYNHNYVDRLHDAHIIDMENLLTQYYDYFDKLHPNASGYQKMGTKILQNLR